ERGARPAAPAAAERRRPTGRYDPVGHEAAEVIDAREVDELARAAQPFDPPAVARPSELGPVVERVAPELAGRAEGVRRRAGDDAALEQRRVCQAVGGAGRDVDREVADQPHPALGRVATEL